MIRPLTIVTFLMACGSGLYLYQTKHESQVLDRTIEKTVHDTGLLREQSRLLSAEWTMLNDPETLRRFADTYLALKPIAPPQFTSLADLDARLPAVRLPPPSRGMDDDAAEPVGSGPVHTPSAAEGQVVTPDVAPAVASDTRPAVPQKTGAAHPIVADHRPAALVRPFVPDGAPSVRPVATADAKPAEPRPPIQQQTLLAQGTPQAQPQTVMPKPAEPRPPLQAQMQPVVSPARAQAQADPTAFHPTDPRLADNRPPLQTRPPFQPPPSAGSLLGMARAPAPQPVPRPTPVNATNWSNAN
jgi:hypothetical protein